MYALFGVALIPVSFFAIRLASDFIHPTVFTRDGPQMTGEMFAAFCCLLGGDHAARLRDVPRRARRQADRPEPPRAARGARAMSSRREVRRGGLRACSSSSSSSGLRSSPRSSRDSSERPPSSSVCARRARRCRWLSCSSGPRCSRTARPRSRTPAGCAARVATAGSASGASAWAGSRRRHCSCAGGLGGRLPVGDVGRGVNLLLARRQRGISLWGCKPRYRLMGLLVMPVAGGLLVLAWAGGGTSVPRAGRRQAETSTLHVGLMLAAFASFTARRGDGAPLSLRGTPAEAP